MGETPSSRELRLALLNQVALGKLKEHLTRENDDEEAGQTFRTVLLTLNHLCIPSTEVQQLLPLVSPRPT